MAKKQAASPKAEPKAAPPADEGPEAGKGPEADDSPVADEGEVLQDHLQQLQFAAAESYEKLSATAAQLTEQVRGVYETGQDSVRRNPISYVMGAFALGCVVGVLLGQD